MDCTCFNPRTHIGCDVLWLSPSQQNLKFQSTHPHRVRLDSIFAVSANEKFQSTHPHRVRHATTERETIPLMFQSTHPHRVRLAKPCPDRHIDCCFNPRTHIGCDLDVLIMFAALGKFQSTHPHRVRHAPLVVNTPSVKFQSTHPHRVRRVSLFYLHVVETVSIHAPT